MKKSSLLKKSTNPWNVSPMLCVLVVFLTTALFLSIVTCLPAGMTFDDRLAAGFLSSIPFAIACRKLILLIGNKLGKEVSNEEDIGEEFAS